MKILGFRVELAEVEAAPAGYPVSRRSSSWCASSSQGPNSTSTCYTVLRNDENQHSLWPAFAPAPAG